MAYLGVDEKAIRKGHRYATILTNLEGRHILEVTPDRSQDSLVMALRALSHDPIVGASAFSMGM